MDTSETYVKMCEKAGEIQQNWDRQKGDWYTDPFWNNTKQKDDWNIYVLESNEQYLFQPRFTWLPRQDQLQEMMKTFWDCTNENLRDGFIDFMHEKPLDWEMWTNEELWLALVMEVKFNKIWNGEDWGLIP